MIGKNQVFRAIKSKTYQDIKQLTTAIVARNVSCKIFFGGVLPRPSHNLLTKPRIRDFNRSLCASVKKMQKTITRVFYLPVQLQFMSESDFSALYKQDGIHLNEFRRMRLKAALLEQASFIRNN